MAKIRSAFLNERFSTAIKEIGLAFVKSATITHRGNKGTAREDALKAFFVERLPSKYAVTEGEVVDILGNTSPQMDLMFYDQSVDFALYAESTSILPAEALLATIEVKSKLTQAEITKSVTAARKLRALHPFGKPLAGRNAGEGHVKGTRYFHCIFAYDTDLSADFWLEKEAGRLSNSVEAEHLIDGVYVLNRGAINMGYKMGRLEDENGGAITEFYFSILNFIQREAGRRGATPYEKYVRPEKKAWVKL